MWGGCSQTPLDESAIFNNIDGKRMLLSTYGESVRFECPTKPNSGVSTYQWYKIDEVNNEEILLENANHSYYETGEIDKGIYHYICKVTNQIEDNGSGGKKSETKPVDYYVAYTELPTLYITTEKDVTSKEENVKGNFKLIASRIKNGYDDLELEMEIKGRGNSSWSMPKKSYNINLKEKKKVLGMGKSKKWALIANYVDKTFLRCNYVSYLNHNVFLDSENNSTLGWNPSYVHVDVIMNGEYIGNYTLAERIKIDNERVNIADISKDFDNGGFICEINERFDELFNFRTTHGTSWAGKDGLAISLKEPDEVSKEVQIKVQKIVQDAEDALFSEDFKDYETGYAKYFDVEALVDWYILHEYIKMRDATCFFTSAYFYYDPSDKKLHMGPCWDYDTGAGNSDDSVNCQSYGFDLKLNATWFSKLFEDEAFVNLVKRRWNILKSNLVNSLTYLNLISEELTTSAEYNFLRWDILGKNAYGFNPAGYRERLTYQSEIDWMKNWLSRRIVWLDTNINAL